MRKTKIKPMFSLTHYLQATATRKLDKAEFRAKRREAKKEMLHEHHEHEHEHNEECAHEEDHGEQ